MIPQKLRTAYSIFIVIFLISLFFFFSCEEKRTTDPKKCTTSAEVSKLTALADKFYAANKTDSAFFYFNKAKSIANPETDFKKIAYSLLNMAEIQKTNSDYAGSEVNATEAIQYIPKINNVNYTWSVYLMLGINASYTFDFENSIHYYTKAYNLKTDRNRKLAVKNNIALVYVEQKKYKEAIKVFESIINQREIKENPVMFSRVLDNLGNCYALTNNPKALDYLNRALEIRIKQNNTIGLGASYFHFATFFSKSNPALAKKNALLSYEKYSLVNSINDRLNALELIIKNSDGDELKEKTLLYIHLNDSILEVRQKIKNQFAKLKYDSKKEKDENFKLRTQTIENELQLERQRNRNFISYLIIGFSLVLLLILYYYLTIKGRRDKNDATYSSEIRIAKKLHDELANDVYHTMAFAENTNLALAENKEQLLNNLDTIYSRTRNISKENSIIITNENYALYLKEMISGFNTPNTTILLNGLHIINWCTIEKNKKITIYRVIQELLVNMKKHSGATLVGITFKIVDKHIFFNYNDNGKGININQMILKNGLHNVENRIRAIKGTVDFDSAPNKGFKVFFKISL